MTLKQMAKEVGIDEESRLRDLFAGRVLAGFVIGLDLSADDRGHSAVAKFCYDRADALLAERKKRLRRKR